MNRLGTHLRFALAWAFVVALTALSATRSEAATIPFDFTGNFVPTTITGTTAPVTLDFILTLNAIYTADPNSSIGGNISISVKDQFSNVTNFYFGFGDVFAGDVGNTGNLLNVTHIPVNVSLGDLPILVEVAATLTPQGGATFSPTLTVDFSGADLSVASQTPLPGALLLFASGLGVLGLARSRRRQTTGGPMETATGA